MRCRCGKLAEGDLESCGKLRKQENTIIIAKMEERGPVRFELFGGFRVLVDGQEVQLPEQAYLSYLRLIVMSGSVRRWQTDDRARDVLLKANKPPRMGLGGRYNFHALTGLKLNYSEGVGVFMEGDWTSDVEEFENIWESRRRASEPDLVRAEMLYRTGIRPETWRQDGVLIAHHERFRARIDELRGYYRDIQDLLSSVPRTQVAKVAENEPDVPMPAQPLKIDAVAPSVAPTATASSASRDTGRVRHGRKVHPLFPLIIWSLLACLAYNPLFGTNEDRGLAHAILQLGALFLFTSACTLALIALKCWIVLIRQTSLGRAWSTTVIGFSLIPATYYLKVVWVQELVYSLMVLEFIVTALILFSELQELRAARGVAGRVQRTAERNEQERLRATENQQGVE